jgi:hypothetical protein
VVWVEGISQREAKRIEIEEERLAALERPREEVLQRARGEARSAKPTPLETTLAIPPSLKG